MAEWTSRQKNFWFRCKPSAEITTQDEDTWVDDLYKDNPEFHNDNDDMINDEAVMETNG